MIGNVQVLGEADDRLCHRINAISLCEEGNNQNGGRKGKTQKLEIVGMTGSSDSVGGKKSVISILYQSWKMKHVRERRGGGTRVWP